jgi:glycogen debranching enzyme
MRERIHVHLYGREPADLVVDVLLAADFRHMFVIRGIVDIPPAPVTAEPVMGGVRFSAVTSDGVERSTTVLSSREPAEIRGGGLRFSVQLQPGAHEDIVLDYELLSGDARPSLARPPDPLRVSRAGVRSDDELFNRVVQRSIADLRMLRSPLDSQTYYAAGVPWFATLFGRDSLITATEVLGMVPDVGEHTVRALSQRLGRGIDPIHEEEPGKVIHELRVGEVAARNLTPLTRYYGSVDATPLFLCLLADHTDWTGSLRLFRELRGAVEATLGWIEQYGDHDGDGLLDYRAGTPHGLRNQGWKDSDDGVIDGRGVPLEPPIALVEPQGYAIRALRGIARLYDADGDASAAGELRERAAGLEAQLDRFWIERRGFYGMGIDGSGRPSAALASNQGHLLWSGAVPHDRAAAVRDALMSDAVFSGWGIRTLGSTEAAYNPVGYHLGTVWPHDTALCAVGLRNYGFDEDFTLLFESMLEAASHAEGYRLPELFAGFSRTEYEAPVPYPVACHPQAWAAGAIPYMLINGLGLKPDALNGCLRVRRPSLPRWVTRVEVENVHVADSRVDLLFERSSAGEHVALTEARIDGAVEVVLEISATRQ